MSSFVGDFLLAGGVDSTFEFFSGISEEIRVAGAFRFLLVSFDWM
jgi:hypothetical protein